MPIRRWTSSLKGSSPAEEAQAKILINAASLGIIFMLMPTFFAYFKQALSFDEWGTLVPWFNTSWLIEAVFIMFVLCIFHLLHNTAMNFVALRRSEPEGGVTL